MTTMTKTRVPADKLVALIQKAYELSVPQGLGILHYKEGPMPADLAASIVLHASGMVINMDYVQGRAVKLVIFDDEDGYYLREFADVQIKWFDHTNEQYDELLKVLA